MRWEQSVVDLRTFTLLWNKAMNDFSPSVTAQHPVVCATVVSQHGRAQGQAGKPAVTS